MKAARLLFLLCAIVGIGCPGMGQVIRLYGYHALKTPSNLFAPGTMVWVKSNSPFTAGVICTQDMSLGGSFRPISSPTASREMSSAVDKEFALDVDYLNVLRGDARFRDISTVRVRLENPMIYELTDVDVIRHAIDRSPLCRQAIAMRHRAGYSVSMIASALKADVTYSVVWQHETSLDAQAKVSALENLAVELGAERSSVSEESISAKDLYWGIRDDIYLAHLSDPENVVAEAGRTRAITAAAAPVISRVPDIKAASATAEASPGVTPGPQTGAQL